MERQYLARINKEVDSDWGASVPDLPGCVATGKTIDAALRRIEGAIELHVRGLRERAEDQALSLRDGLIEP